MSCYGVGRDARGARGIKPSKPVYDASWLVTKVIEATALITAGIILGLIMSMPI